jgi:hypothetical protein
MVVVEHLEGVERSDVRRRGDQVVDVERCRERRKREGRGRRRRKLGVSLHGLLPHTMAR